MNIEIFNYGWTERVNVYKLRISFSDHSKRMINLLNKVFIVFSSWIN